MYLLITFYSDGVRQKVWYVELSTGRDLSISEVKCCIFMNTKTCGTPIRSFSRRYRAEISVLRPNREETVFQINKHKSIGYIV